MVQRLNKPQEEPFEKLLQSPLFLKRYEQFEQEMSKLSPQMEQIRDSLDDENLRRQAEKLGQIENLIMKMPDSARCLVRAAMYYDMYMNEAQTFMIALARYKKKEKR